MVSQARSARTQVIVEGEPGREMYMIITGELEVTKGDAKYGQEYRLGFLSEGSFFGESAVMNVSAHHMCR